jgi:hypothetical protein
MKGIALVLGFLLLPAVIIGIWLFIVYNRDHRRCVELKNGMNLGYAAVFDLSKLSLMPTAVPKFRDGTPLIENGTWSIFVTDTTVYGWALGETPENDFSFAWRADTGLVLAREDLNSYEKLVSEAGDANPGVTINNVGTEILMREFMKRPEYKRQWCRTRFVTW